MSLGAPSASTPLAAPAVVGATAPERLVALRAGADVSDFIELVDDHGATSAVTLHELLDLARAWGAQLRHAGLEPGDRLAIIEPHGLTNYTAFLGALLVGLVPSIWTPPSPRLARDDYERTLHRLLGVARPRGLVATPELARALPRGDGVLDVVLGSDPPARGAPDTAQVGAPARPDDIAFLQYSSGTTGLRKGVAITHRALLWQVDRYAETIGLDRTDRVASWLPLYHDMGLVACFLMPVLRGTPVTAMCPFAWARRPAAWLDMVDRSSASLSWLPNFAYAFLARQVTDADLARRSLASLRGIVNCSEPIRAETHEQFVARFGPRALRAGALAASYAMAENTFAVTSAGFGVPLITTTRGERRSVSSGVPLPETEVRILDEQGRPVPAGGEGEIEITSPCLLQAYDRNAAATRRALVDGRLRTGDLGFLEDGHLFVIGRADDRINARGHNVHPEDVEHAAGQVDGIVPGRVAAIAVPDVELGSDELVVLAETREPPEGRARLSESVRHAVSSAVGIAPGDVRIVEHGWLRKSSSGKIARRACRERYLEAAADPKAFEAPAADERVHDELARLVRARRGATITRDTRLVSTGLIDSLGLVETFHALERACGVVIDAEVIAAAGDVDRVGDFERLVAAARAVADAPHAPMDAVAAPAETNAPEAATTDPAQPVRRGLDWRAALARTRLRLRRHGCGPGLRVHGPLLLRLEGAPGSRIVIGRNVTFMPGVDLKIRERGRITIGDGVMLDTNVRLVAANDAHLVVGARTRIAMGTIVNAGTDVTFGADVLVGAHSMIVSSDHRYDGSGPIREQGYRYAPVRVGDGAWLASGTVVLPGSTIGTGAVLGAASTLDGHVPDGMVAAGRPARVVRKRPP